MMSDFIQVFQKWQTGSLPEDTILWGMKIFFWGRIGALVQLLSGLFIVFEIIGPDRLREFGKTLDGNQLLDEVAEWENRNFNKISQFIGRSFFKGADMSVSQQSNPVAGIANAKNATLAQLGIFSVFFYSVLVILQNNQNSPQVFSWLVYALLISIVIFTTIILIFFLLLKIGALMNLLIFRPIACILTLKYINEYLKIIALLLFVAGSILSFFAM